MTDTQLLLEKQVELYALLPADQRAVIRKEAANLANGNYPADTVKFNRELLQKMQRVEIAIQAQGKPQPPTAQETRACLLWMGGIVGGVVTIAGGLYIAGAMVVGIGEAVRIWAVSNATVIGWVIAAGLAILAIGALPRWKGEDVEGSEGGTAENTQNITVNVFTSQSGDVTVIQDK